MGSKKERLACNQILLYTTNETGVTGAKLQKLEFGAAWRALRQPAEVELASPKLKKSAPKKRSLFPLLRSALLIALIGAAVLVIGIAAEAVHDQAGPGSKPLPNAVLTELMSFPIWLKLWTEVGYACLIAAVVSFFIEATARREQTELFEEAISDIGASVLQGVYQIQHDPDYVRAVINSCLAVKLVREETEITYTISEFSPEECIELGIKHETFVRVDAEISYAARNISGSSETFLAAYNIPKRHGRVGDFAMVTALDVGTTRHDAAALEKLTLAPDHDDYNENTRGYRFPLPVTAGERTRVVVVSQFAKERSDNEMFTFLLPTLGAKIRFIFSVPDLEIGATANMAAELPTKKEIFPGKHVKWDIAAPLIPFNSVTIWWRTPKDGGSQLEDEVSQLVAATSADTEESEPVRPETGTQTLQIDSKWANLGRQAGGAIDRWIEKIW